MCACLSTSGLGASPEGSSGGGGGDTGAEPDQEEVPPAGPHRRRSPRKGRRGTGQVSVCVLRPLSGLAVGGVTDRIKKKVGVRRSKVKGVYCQLEHFPSGRPTGQQNK